VNCDYNSELFPVYCDPYNNSLEILETDGELAKVRDRISGAEGLVLKERIHCDENACYIWENLNSFPSVKKDEIVSVCRTLGGYTQIIAENGQVGWIPAKLLY